MSVLPSLPVAGARGEVNVSQHLGYSKVIDRQSRDREDGPMHTEQEPSAHAQAGTARATEGQSAGQLTAQSAARLDSSTAVGRQGSTLQQVTVSLVKAPGPLANLGILGYELGRVELAVPADGMRNGRPVSVLVRVSR